MVSVQTPVTGSTAGLGQRGSWDSTHSASPGSSPSAITLRMIGSGPHVHTMTREHTGKSQICAKKTQSSPPTAIVMITLLDAEQIAHEGGGARGSLVGVNALESRATNARAGAEMGWSFSNFTAASAVRSGVEIRHPAWGEP
jgi:hypothetical protein